MVRLIKWLVGLLFVGWIASFVAAIAAKRRIVVDDDPENDEVAVAAIFAPLAFESVASSFRGGTVDCWYGGGIIDLRGATLDPAGATLEVHAMFGGGQILVPDDWRVTAAVHGIGGVRDIRPGAASAEGAELVITGWVAFGGFAIGTESPDGGVRWTERAHTGD